MPTPFAWRHRRRHRTRGQSLAEFALALPVFLLILLVAIDFGRAFFSYIAINNAARVGANYAAMHPNDTYPNATYAAQVNTDAGNAFNGVCPLTTGTNFNPMFIDGPDANATTRDLGDSARVGISCTFRPLTPVIGNIINNVRLQATATFPLRTGAIP